MTSDLVGRGSVVVKRGRVVAMVVARSGLATGEGEDCEEFCSSMTPVLFTAGANPTYCAWRFRVRSPLNSRSESASGELKLELSLMST